MVAAGLIGIFSLMIMAVFVASVYSDFGYCKSSEAMLNELNRLKIQSIPVNFEDFFNFLSVKVSNFSNSFLYKSEYQVNYLPGVLDLNNKNQLFAMNAVVRLYVIGLLAFVSIATLVRVVTVLRNCFRGNVFTALSASQSSIAAALICVPGIILIVYDNQQYFYRSIFINLAFSLSAVLYLADMPKIKAPMAKWLIFLGFAFPLVLSVYFNYKLFYYRLPDWSAIYSMPGKAIEGGSLEDISKLAEQCNISLPEGGFVVDSATYDHLKQYRNLQLIWYIEYQSTVTGLTIPEILKLSNSRNVIASCSAIERSEVGFPYLQRRGNLCCYRYTNDPDAR